MNSEPECDILVRINEEMNKYYKQYWFLHDTSIEIMRLRRELADARAVIPAARAVLYFLPDDDTVPPRRSAHVDAVRELRKALDLCWTRKGEGEL